VAAAPVGPGLADLFARLLTGFLGPLARRLGPIAHPLGVVPQAVGLLAGRLGVFLRLADGFGGIDGGGGHRNAGAKGEGRSGEQPRDIPVQHGDTSPDPWFPSRSQARSKLAAETPRGGT